jgi:hypothetical protein
MILLAKLDRLAIGTILRSKLVFLIIVRLYVAFIEGARRKAVVQTTFCRVWTLIMRAIKCLKGVRWMPWR